MRRVNGNMKSNERRPFEVLMEQVELAQEKPRDKRSPEQQSLVDAFNNSPSFIDFFGGLDEYVENLIEVEHARENN